MNWTSREMRISEVNNFTIYFPLDVYSRLFRLIDKPWNFLSLGSFNEVFKDVIWWSLWWRSLILTGIKCVQTLYISQRSILPVPLKIPYNWRVSSHAICKIAWFPLKLSEHHLWTVTLLFSGDSIKKCGLHWNLQQNPDIKNSHQNLDITNDFNVPISLRPYLSEPRYSEWKIRSRVIRFMSGFNGHVIFSFGAFAVFLPESMSTVEASWTFPGTCPFQTSVKIERHPEKIFTENMNR